jgi:hypothetical protein
MKLIRVQMNPDSPEEMCDQSTLMKWAKSGKLLPKHQIWDSDTKAWVVAKEYPFLASFYSQVLWEAWDEEDQWELDPDIETGIRRIQEQRQTKRKGVNESQLKGLKVVAPTLPTLPSSAIRPLILEEKKEIPTLNVMATEPIIIEPSQFWKPDIPLHDQPLLWVKKERPPSSFSIVRLSILVIPMILVFLIFRLYILSESTADFPLESEIGKGEVRPELDTVFMTLENDIRAALRKDIQQISPLDSLSDALRVDLEFAKMEIQYIDAEVLSWRGRHLDLPNKAEIRIAIQSKGEPDREISTIAMIVAKYNERYKFQMEEFTIVFQMEETAFQKNINVRDSRNLLLHPGGLERFLDIVMQ